MYAIAAGAYPLITMASPVARYKEPVSGSLGDFFHAFADFEGWHRDLRSRLTFRDVEATFGEVREPFLARLDALASLQQRLTATEQSAALRVVKESELMGWALEAPYYERIVKKPRGYAGDAEMMRIIYAGGYAGQTPFGRLYHRLATSVRECQAVRNRRTFLAGVLCSLSGPERVLSLACGPCAELADALADTSFQFLGVDHDTETLRDVERLGLDPARVRLGLGNAFQLVAGTPRVFFPRRIATSDPQRDLAGIRRTLAPPRYTSERLRRASFGLVYSAGLFDYVWEHPTDDRKGAVGLVTKLFSLVKPGGELIIGNFGPGMTRGTRFFMEYVCDWHLIYRDEAQLVSLARHLPRNEVASLGIEQEPEGINLFLRVRKSPS